jgi:hypothetical protein
MVLYHRFSDGVVPAAPDACSSMIAAGAQARVALALGALQAAAPQEPVLSLPAHQQQSCYYMHQLLQANTMLKLLSPTAAFAAGV